MAVMFARLRPDKACRRALLQHVVSADPRNVPAVVAAFCGMRFAVIDLDPRFAERLAGCPCPLCITRAPRQAILRLAAINGRLWPSEDDVGPSEDDVGTSEEPVRPYVYAKGLAVLDVRHIVPDHAPRHPHSGRLVLIAECGHMAWCPVTGPWPSYDWKICAGCLDIAQSRS